MDRMLYVSMSGAKQNLMAQSVNTNNLANVSTTGFRADLKAFESLPVNGPGYASRVYAVASHGTVDLRPGPLMSTGRELDVAVDGEGYIAIQAPDGSEAYTRSGSLRINTVGQLETASGHPVLGNGGPLALPPFEKLEIGSDGTVSVRPIGQDATALVVVDRIKLVKPDAAQLQKGDDGLLRVAGNAPLAPDASVGLAQGVLEGSNVNAVSAMVSMIELAREFEMHVKMMSTADENQRATDQLLRLS